MTAHSNASTSNQQPLSLLSKLKKSEGKMSKSGFNHQNSWTLTLLTLAFVVGEMSRYLLVSLSKEMARDIGFGDKGCYLMGEKRKSVDQLPSHKNHLNADLVSPTSLSRAWSHARAISNATTTNSQTTYSQAFCQQFTSNKSCTLEGMSGAEVICQYMHNGQGLDYLILAGTYFILVFTVSGILMGYLADKVHRPHLLSACVALFSVCGTGMAVATEYWHLVLLRMGIATGEAALRPAGGSLIAEIFDVETRGKANGIFNWGVYFGIGLTFTLGNYVAPANIMTDQGWRSAFVIGSLPGIVVAVLLTCLSDPRPKRKVSGSIVVIGVGGDDLPASAQRRETKAMIKPRRSHLNREGEYWKSVLTALTSAEMILLLVAATIRQAGGFTWVFNAQLFFNEHYPDFNPGLWLTLCTIFGGTLGLLFGGYLSDMAVRSLGLHSRLWILALTSFVAAPLSVGVLVMDTPYNFTFLLLYFFFADTWFGVLFTVISELVPQDVRSVVIAIFIFLMNNIGGQIPLAIDPLRKAFSLRQALLMIWPGCIATCAVFFLLASLPLWAKHKQWHGKPSRHIIFTQSSSNIVNSSKL